MTDGHGSQSALLLLQSVIATSIFNLDSNRIRNPSQETRQVGWTEEWGCTITNGTSNSHQEKEKTSQSSHVPSKFAILFDSLFFGVFDLDKEEDNHDNSQYNNHNTLTLVQFRPAWFEQLLLILLEIPFHLVNAPYAATEATGPLPYVQQNQHLVGFAHPGMATNNKNSTSTTTCTTTNNYFSFNHILNYLHQQEQYKDHTLFQSLSSNNKNNRMTTHLITTLVLEQLQPALEVLRFQDNDAWTQIYRPQYLSAANNNSAAVAAAAQKNTNSNNGGRFQTWSIRTLHHAMTTNHHNLKSAWNLDKAKIVLTECLSTLEEILNDTMKPETSTMQENDTNNDPTITPPTTNTSPTRVYSFLDLDMTTTTTTTTTTISIVDVLVWATLCDALTDVYAVTVLANYPNLITFYQRIHAKYFAIHNNNDDDNHNKVDYTSKLEHARINAMNAFCVPPLLISSSLSSTRKRSYMTSFLYHHPAQGHNQQSLHKYTHALELMQSLRPNHFLLQDVLKHTQYERVTESNIPLQVQQRHLLYQWRMGGSGNTTSNKNTKEETKKTNDTDDANDNNDNHSEENNPASSMNTKWKTEHKVNDELWVSTVIAITGLAMIFGTRS